MSVNLRTIAATAAAECVRQGVDLHALTNLLSGYEHAYRMRNRLPTVESVVTLGSLIEPDRNHNGFRVVPVTFANLTTAVEPRLVPGAVDRMMRFLDWHADGVAKAFLDVHPFIDGNGRVAWILLNWIDRTLDDPRPLPEYYEVAS